MVSALLLDIFGQRGDDSPCLSCLTGTAWWEEVKLKTAEADFLVFLDNWYKGSSRGTSINVECYCNSSCNAIQIQSQQKIECCTESETWSNAGF